MSLREMATLRTKLREVNIEYGALVRSKAAKGRFVKLGELRVERQALIMLIAEERGHDGMPTGCFRSTATHGCNPTRGKAEARPVTGYKLNAEPRTYAIVPI